jgi:filamentous hemagglutinin family protein
MKDCYLEKWLLAGSVFYALISSNPTAAQVVGDTTLPIGERSLVTGNPNFQIDGGATRGSNLFHSFTEFSVPNGGSAYFNNAADIQNILTRVTGGSISNIDGLIRANDTANLFLLNPNGILFGAGAQLNIGGSFIASTANSINFADNFHYSATNPQTAPLLTVSVPIGLQMGANPKPIVVRGNGYNLSTLDPIFSPLTRGSNSTGLRVPTGRTLALIGGDIELIGSTLTAEQGRIDLGSVRDAQVSLDGSFALSYPGVQNFGNIRLSQQALADASGGGSIQVQGNQVFLSDGSLLLIQNQGTQAGGSIRVNAAQSLELSGTSPDGRIPTSLDSHTVGVESGADVAVSTRQLLVRDGAAIVARSFSPSRTGDVTTQAFDSVQIIGESSINPTLVSNIATAPFSSGDAGNVTVSTKELTILGGGTISASTFGTGRSGNLTVNALDLIKLIGQSSQFAQSSLSSVSLGAGDAGRVTVNTSRLVIQDGGTVSTSTTGIGSAGSLTINATESVEVSGRPPAPALPSFVGSSAPIATDVMRQGLRLPPVPTGFSGNVTINTKLLSVTDGARVEVSNEGVGNAGKLIINANSIVLDTRGAITAATASGEGGSIELNVQDVLLRNNSQITTSAGGTGNGGDISITARSLSALDGSQLSAATAGAGNAGNITFSADMVGLSSGGRLLTTTSSSGRAGNITVKTPDLKLSGATSGLFAGTTGAGDAGNLTIQPQENGQSVRVNLQGGAQISASTSSIGKGGQLTITAPESITLTGDGSIIAAETGGSGTGGNLNLTTDTLNIQKQAEVTVSSEGTGSAGSLFVNANQIYLNNGGRIRADTSGGGGNITLRSPLILLRNGSSITTNARGSNILGGNIDIYTDNLVAVPSENNDISANSANFRGGNVTITASGIFGIDFREQLTPLSDITATGVTSGTVNLIILAIDPSRGLAELPTGVVDASNEIATGCRGVQGSSFVVTGRGGLPPTPQQALGDDPRWRDWRTPAVVSRQPNATANEPLPRSANPPSTKSARVEATGWVFGADGKVILTATAPNVTSSNRWGQPVNCAGHKLPMF